MRRTPLVLGTLVALAMVAVAWLFYRAFGQGGGVQYGVRSYVVASDSRVRVEFEVAKDPARTAVCTVRARDRTGAEAGSAQVTVGPAAGRSTIVSYDLTTTSRAATGEVTGCVLTPTGLLTGPASRVRPARAARPA